MSIEVFEPAEDGLSRKVWRFSMSHSYTNSVRLSVTMFGIERRKAVRGRFSAALPKDRWFSGDERSYNSGLSRPTSVPAWVLDKAKAAIEVELFIGWPNAEHRINAQGTSASG